MFSLWFSWQRCSLRSVRLSSCSGDSTVVTVWIKVFFRAPPAGCSSGFLLWKSELPPIQLERSGWCVSLCVSDWHPGLSGLHRREQDPGHPQSAAPAANTASSQVNVITFVLNFAPLMNMVQIFMFSFMTFYFLYHVWYVLAGMLFDVLVVTALFVLIIVFFRVISRAPGLKLVVETLITSLRPIGNIVLICCAFFIVFGILGVQVVDKDLFYLLYLYIHISIYLYLFSNHFFYMWALS